MTKSNQIFNGQNFSEVLSFCSLNRARLSEILSCNVKLKKLNVSNIGSESFKLSAYDVGNTPKYYSTGKISNDTATKGVYLYKLILGMKSLGFQVVNYRYLSDFTIVIDVILNEKLYSNIYVSFINQVTDLKKVTLRNAKLKNIIVVKNKNVMQEVLKEANDTFIFTVSDGFMIKKTSDGAKLMTQDRDLGMEQTKNDLSNQDNVISKFNQSQVELATFKHRFKIEGQGITAPQFKKYREEVAENEIKAN